MHPPVRKYRATAVLADILASDGILGRRLCPNPAVISPRLCLLPPHLESQHTPVVRPPGLCFGELPNPAKSCPWPTWTDVRIPSATLQGDPNVTVTIFTPERKVESKALNSQEPSLSPDKRDTMSPWLPISLLPLPPPLGNSASVHGPLPVCKATNSGAGRPGHGAGSHRRSGRR